MGVGARMTISSVYSKITTFVPISSKVFTPKPAYYRCLITSLIKRLKSIGLEGHPYFKPHS